MKKFEVINEPSELKGFWPFDSFNEVYPDSSAIKGSSLVCQYDDENPEKVSVVLMRTFIENGHRAKTDQKYVVGIRFYSFGDMATIDVISLDEGYHKEICYEHLKRLKWPMWSEELNMPVDEFGETTRSPFLFIGGHLKVRDSEVNFFGSSGDYGDKILFSDGNSIATYAAFVSGIELSEGKNKIGESFVKEILQFMYDHKLEPDFYEQLVADPFSKNLDEKITLTSQHVGALVTMKVADRMIEEGKDMLTLMVDEMTGGLSRAMMIHGVARRIRSKNEED